MNSDGNKEDISGSDHELKKSVDFRDNLWVPPIFLLLILLAFVVYLLVPGTLIYPKSQIATDLFGSNRASVEAEIERSLELRIKELEMAIDNGICSAGVFEIPNDAVSLLPPTSNGNTIPYDNKRPLIIPPIDQLSAQLPESNLSIEGLIRKSTVLIVSGSGENASFGTGFFINRNFIVTNAHVVENETQAVRAYIDGKREPVALSIRRRSTAFEDSGRDYAVLMSSEPSDFFLSLQKQQGSIQLQSVISAGFPGDALELLADLQQSENFDNPDKLPLFMTTGIVNAEQKIKGKEDAIIHSATISQGNSGGPLINTCGRVLGINTFISTSEVRTLNIALSVSGLRQFLKDAAIDFYETDEACSPRLVTLEPPQEQ
jgi:hypothetical protein